MTIAIGTRLGRYEIRSKIGEGGMGEVYRARDQKLNRDVAVKVLPAELSKNSEWRHDGKELFYLAPDRKLMVVEVDSSGPSFVAGVPKPLFEAHVSGIFPGVSGAYYAVTGDGQRFLVNTLVGESTPAPFTVVMNWTAGLKK